jgi:hypothetical protein
MDEYVRARSDNLEYWLHKLIKTTRFNDDCLKNSAVRGWLNNWDNFKTNQIDIANYKRQLANRKERSIQMDEQLMTQFEETIEYITRHGVRVVLVNTPTLDLLNDYEPEKYQRMMAWFRDFANNHALVDFVDYSPKYASEHTIFSDRLHLNVKGQQMITTELIQYLREAMKDSLNNSENLKL